MTTYLTDFLHGRTTGMAEALGWTGLVLLGIAIAGAIVLGLCALVRYLERFELTDDEPEPTERRSRSRDRYETLIFVLGCLIAPAVIAFTR